MHAITHNIYATLEHCGREYTVKATGFYSLSGNDDPDFTIREYSLQDFELGSLDHLPEELRQALEQNDYDHVFQSRLQEAELM